MQSEIPSDLFEKARLSPTIEIWKDLIQAALLDRLDGMIGRHLGTIEEVFSTAVSNSAHPLAAETFHAALEEVVSAWNPAAVRSLSSMETMLRLIQDNLPPSGFIRLLGFLIEGGTFPSRPLRPFGSGGANLDDLSWETLRSYFLVAPLDPSAHSGFSTYLRYVQSQLANPARRTDACIRLIELGHILPDGAALGKQINSHPAEIVSGLVTWLLTSHRSDKDILITQIYLHCQETKTARIAFETSLEVYGSSVTHTDNQALISYRDGRSVSIPFTKEGGYEMSLSNEWQDMSEVGFAYLTDIAAQEGE